MRAQLWVNMIMDTFAALALATDPPYEELLHRKPYGRNDTIICASMWRNIICQAVYQFTILILLLFLRDSTGENMMMFPNIKLGSIPHNTIMFNTFVFMQIGNMFCSRRAYNGQALVPPLPPSLSNIPPVERASTQVAGAL